jgi:hypothetical protein
MKKPRLLPRLPAKPLHDLACSKCGRVNLSGSTSDATVAFCPFCQQNTQHYSVATQQTESTTPFGLPKRRKGKSLYSPEGKKKMGFGK